jgi:hypothetical protein
MTMPGLPKVPLADKIDLDEDGVIHNLSWFLRNFKEKYICY